jgi:hypothetical protein
MVDFAVLLHHTGSFWVSKSILPVDFETNSLNPIGNERVTSVGYVVLVVTIC